MVEKVDKESIIVIIMGEIMGKEMIDPGIEMGEMVMMVEEEMVKIGIIKICRGDRDKWMTMKIWIGWMM